jgi:hypothetical protein
MDWNGDINKYYYFPIFLDFRYFFLNNTLTPVFISEIGYSFASQGYSGLLYNFSLGITKFFTEDISYTISIGYKMQVQKPNFGDSYYIHPPSKVVTFQFYSFNIGLSI